jgi:hypothetical protein
MPGIADPYYRNDPQEFSGFDPLHDWHTAQGIAMTSIDDLGRFNSYPLMRVQAVDIASGDVIATTDAVVPVSPEVDCRDCHGADHLGTRLSRVPVDRVLKDADRVVRATLQTGEIVSCDLCHDLDKSFED